MLLCFKGGPTTLESQLFSVCSMSSKRHDDGKFDFIARSNLPDDATASGNDLLPENYTPSDKDIICGRARENFHHDGNRYFRDLIQQNVGPYLAARTKIEKSEAIAMIVDKVRQNSPFGGFIKRDASTGRWSRIKDCEARDKVGHAVRKAVQRLEDTKPKLAAKIKKEHSNSNEEAESVSSSGKTVSSQSMVARAQLDHPTSQTLETPSSNFDKSSLNSLYAKSKLDATTKDNVSLKPKNDGQHQNTFKVSPRFMEEDRQSVNWTGSQTSDPARILQQAASASSTQSSVLRSASLHPICLPSVADSIHMPASRPYPSHFNPPDNSTSQLNNVASRLLLSQVHGGLYQNPASRLAPYMQNLSGYGSIINQRGSLFETSNELWLSIAVRQQQEAEQRARELEYARRLALSAFHVSSRLQNSPSAATSVQDESDNHHKAKKTRQKDANAENDET